MKSILLLFLCVSLNAVSLQLVKKEGSSTAPTLLLMGGIQGDEPGGFNTTDIFLMHYKILSGSVWVVPVLNRYSMLRNHRGVYGDLNRKFAYLSPKDPEYPLIQSIKKIITAPQVSVVLHLHDGSGFYRPRYESPLLNPRRWGNSSIIDQNELPAVPFGHLRQVSEGIIANVNKSLLKPIHRYHIRNTHTAKGNIEMEKALTYFAIKHKKPAFANEASKELPLPTRVYYHLLALEGLLKELGIQYSKDFTLSPENLYKLINDPSLSVVLNNNTLLPIYGLRKTLNFFPLPKNTPLDKIPLVSKSYILGLLPRQKQVWLKYGNKLMTRLRPLYLPFDHSLKNVKLEIDGKQEETTPARVVEVHQSFKVLAQKGYRVNVIGYTHKGASDEAGFEITYKDLDKRFSIDTEGRIYRIEFYKNQAFSGMVLARFL
ncbi:M99 family carboxypeptidase catalytic domain-containing protein [Helicobacter ailurogastricus]|uniref:Putative periplasmic protein n=1 Tax=Helicobacter ailurogastricus TaxID=1578720 RepID=A0A0K2XAU3_9HELI|nr:M99 family carboxypeptidase catalytic domain-containing protein [Helicobacter ailurogastricus]CRF40752.1 putative periplasmic protein [Helicobacter ailurogastricus]CRF42458.1 putative periplasmic protein [Helicobacter ailurogastricus]CRF43652.1 putative periplasmic protein [Helicobacter ailurogastricus]